MKVAIQGYQGSFHDIASRKFLDETDVALLEKDSFPEVLGAVDDGSAALGVMAIENTIYGSLVENYQLLFASDLHIVGEVYLRIEQNLLGLKGQTIADIKEVYSHPIALAQCQTFFKQYPGIKLIESVDTAISARDIAAEGQGYKGAVASHLAAETYDLDVIAPSIETNKANHTRFLILSTERSQIGDKVSVTFMVSHQVGCLSDALATLANNSANLTKIQSTPVLGKPWEYRFFADFLLEDETHFDKTIAALAMHCRELRILGRYVKGERT